MSQFHRTRNALPFLVAAAIVFLSAARVQADLKVGDPAPAIKVREFIKGDPIKEFEPGKVYVMEFWATWCGPCIKAIPHISELQEKYKDKGVVVLGTSVWENDPAQAKVKPFVDKMGDKMAYTVATDDRSDGGPGAMAETWLRAAGQEGIPCSFIVDQSGKIAWIGHPMSMGPVLEKVIAGNFDAQIESNRAAAVENLMKEFGTAWRQGNKDGAAKIADAQFDSVKSDPDALNAIGWTLVDQQTVSPMQLQVAEKYALAAVAASNSKRGDILDTLAAVHFKKGEIDKAIELQTKAVNVADTEMKAELEATLKKYKEAKN